jgi:hypothetical protein
MSTPQQIIDKTNDFLKVGTFKQHTLVTGRVTGNQFNTTLG